MNMIRGYASFLSDIKARVRTAQYKALQAVNTELVALYWDLGRMIVRQQRGRSWGRGVVERLSGDLRYEFPSMNGLSVSNLWRMRAIFEAYRTSPKLAPLVREIPWSHNLIILERCGTPREREFYLRMTRKLGWSKNALQQHIENETFTKTLRNQTNFDRVISPIVRRQGRLAVKDEYTFDFLDLAPEHEERELERAILARMERFLQEMGGRFAFVGSQYRLEVGGQEFYIDLLLYHRPLKCLVAVELKAGAFEPEHIGKMQFYLAALDDLVRQPGENPSIGIILCRRKNRTVVEYALRVAGKPIGVATYRVVKRLPRNLQRQLPTPDQVAGLLEDDPGDRT